MDITSLNNTAPVNSTVAYNIFSLNNTGNAQDDLVVEISNQPTLNSLGWKAEMIDSSTGKAVTNVTIAAFHSTQIEVQFTALRDNPDPDATAVILAYSKAAPSISHYEPVPVMLPDLSIGQGDVDATRDDITYEYDMGRIYIDIGLVVALAVLAVMLFYFRRKKGLGGGGKK